jgi:hypothetical protein
MTTNRGRRTREDRRYGCRSAFGSLHFAIDHTLVLEATSDSRNMASTQLR